VLVNSPCGGAAAGAQSGRAKLVQFTSLSERVVARFYISHHGLTRVARHPRHESLKLILMSRRLAGRSGLQAALGPLCHAFSTLTKIAGAIGSSIIKAMSPSSEENRNTLKNRTTISAAVAPLRDRASYPS
jgi:hypothetical protein